MQSLIVFAKNPRYGRVKTRLAADVGEEMALQIYLHLLQHSTQVASAWQAESATERRCLFFYDHHLPAQHPYEYLQAQDTQDLGERMARAFGQSGQDSVIIGTDCPELTVSIVNQAFTLLGSADYSIGQAADGGFYLLGARRFEPAVFSGIRWSTDSVADTLYRNIRSRQYSYDHQLPILNDIDTWADWQDYLRRC